MENLKIKVNSEAESKEAQELFFELGYNWFKKGYVEVKTPETIISFENGALSTGIRGSINHKEITLPELRDMVVLNRNDVGDATHENSHNQKLYKAENGWYIYIESHNAWMWNQEELGYKPIKLKPIEKPMKEYLRKNSNGTYSYIGTVRPEHVSDFMIEIPEGADEFKANGRFYKDSDSFFNISAMVWTRSTLKKDAYATLWKRATHPEELPFIDDEPLQSLNNQYAEIEKVRQSHRTASETSNPTIKETLNQRQSQYGSFEDVAQTTEQLFQVIKGGASFVDFTESQRMALYMIFSKVARLSNGDCNHKDSWHDIAGYATLIDNELESEKDMPF